MNSFAQIGPMKRVLLTGYPTQARAVKRLVNRSSTKWRAVSTPVLVDAVISIGGPQPDPMMAAWAHCFRVPIGIVWTGSDVARIDQGYDAAARVRARRYTHAASSERIQAELHDLGIDADEFPIATSPESDGVAHVESFFERVAANAPASKKRGIVSGNSQRVAAFVEAAATTMPDWEFHAAISGSRTERIDDLLSLITAKRWYRLGDQREDRIFRYAARLFLKRRYRTSNGK